jgi:hypothetical protein
MIGVGDFNEDGFVDVATGNKGVGNALFATSHVFLNDRKGSFSDPGIDLPVAAHTQGIDVADVNRDGHLDIVAGNMYRQAGSTESSGEAVVFYGDGTGKFTTFEKFGPKFALANDIAVGDLNGDGWPDVVIPNKADANHATQSIIVQLNDKKGGLGRSNGQSDTFADARGATIGDVDNDGDNDFVIAVVGEAGVQNDFVFLNR